ncbi:transketolase [uncultured Dubosiella sp.]|uniref:transketolase n=1 Tax=uncultured Dubosiella sp. TaxID=1937011 RepID=UPI0027316AF6|nr:transketolase [uncultured Dubosiella sp.]
MNTSTMQQKANEIRQDIIRSIYEAGSGHPGGSLSCADILTVLYFHEMNIDPENPEKEDRDRFVLSKGHCAPAYYATLANRGYFEKEELWKLRKMGAMLQGHPDMKHTPGVDMSTGSLGQGVSAACGMAYALKQKKSSARVYCLLGDGEIQEGQVWEAAMFAAAKQLDNLVLMIDNNNLQIDGTIEEVNSPYPIDQKFASFNFHVENVEDGHDINQLLSAFNKVKKSERPAVIIAKTIKGKGVSFMENQAGWHGKAPNIAQKQQALQELNERMTTL